LRAVRRVRAGKPATDYHAIIDIGENPFTCAGGNKRTPLVKVSAGDVMWTIVGFVAGLTPWLIPFGAILLGLWAADHNWIRWFK
jgi:hypothetical protein